MLDLKDGGLEKSDESGIDDIITYQLLLNNFEEDLAGIKENQTTTIKLRNIKKYIKDFESNFKIKLCTRSQIVKELFLLHQTGKALDRYNDDILKMNYVTFRALIYFPNMFYMYIRLLPSAGTFIQKMVRKVYQEFNNKAKGLVNIHVNSLYIDQDVIKSEILHSFFGNGLKKINPLDVGNVKAFYRSCFRSLFEFYFRRRKNLEDQEMIEFSYIVNEAAYERRISNRVAIYKDVLYDIRLKKAQKKHYVLSHIMYNFQIFKNIIISNEFQSIYQNIKGTELSFQNKQYQLIDFTDDDLFLKNPELFNELRQLPLIYKLLRCAHIQSERAVAYNDFLIKPDVVSFAIKEELSKPFKNFFIDTYVSDILDRISKNFVKSILSGEYINLITFSTVRINHVSFTDQLRKFIRLCLRS